MPTVYVKLGGLCWPKRGGPTGSTQVGQEGMEFLEFGCARRWAYGGSDAPSSALGCHGMPWDATGGEKICPNKYPINQISKMLLMSGVRSFLHQLARVLEVLQTSQ